MLLFPFPLLPVALSLRDAPKSILWEPKWGGAQAVVWGARPPWPPRSDGTGDNPSRKLQTVLRIAIPV